MPDGVAGNVLSFWPPAARYIEARRPGTGQLSYRPMREVQSMNYWNGATCPICFQRQCPGGYPGCAGGRPLLGLIRTELFYHSISASPAYSGKSFEELRLEDYDLGRAEGRWWVGGTLQTSRVCATCRRSLDKLNFSRTQWNKKQVGVSRCKGCVQLWGDTDMEKISLSLAETLAQLNT